MCKGYFRFLLVVFAALSTVISPAHATAAKAKKKLDVAIVLSPNISIIDDKSFIHAVQKGVERAAKENGNMKVRTELQDPTQDEYAFVNSVAGSGVDIIVAVSFVNVSTLLSVSEKHPNVKFMIIDGVAPPFYPNVKSIIFREHEGSFLVGMLAALKSKSGKIGFVGGRDVPLIRNFAWGYRQGAEYVNPSIQISEVMVGNGPEAWDSPDKAESLANAQYKLGADVIFAAAGASGLGVLKAASEKPGRYAIGVDSNQNGLYPGHVLTSMIKHVDTAVYNALLDVAKGNWNPGIENLGLKEYAVNYVVDENNRPLLDEAMLNVVESARQQIISGSLQVKMYSPTTAERY